MERGELDRRLAELPGLTRPALLQTPETSLNQAFAWAARREPAGAQADPAAVPEWDAGDLADLIEQARSFRRVGPAAVPEPGVLLRWVVAGLFGVRADGPGGRVELRPWIPEGWRSLALRRLRCHRTLLDLEVRARAEWATVRIELTFGPPIPATVGLRNVPPVAQVSIDEVPVGGNRAVLTLQGRHEVAFFFRGDTP